MNGKGSKRRPTFVPLHEFGDNWAKIFEKPKQTEKENDNSRDAEKENERLDVAKQADSPTDTNGRDTL